MISPQAAEYLKKQATFQGEKCWKCTERDAIPDGLWLCQECRDELRGRDELDTQAYEYGGFAD